MPWNGLLGEGFSGFPSPLLEIVPRVVQEFSNLERGSVYLLSSTS
jgi:hypothetical protein